MACLCSVSPSPFRAIGWESCIEAVNQRQMLGVAWRQQTPRSPFGHQAWQRRSDCRRIEAALADIGCEGGGDFAAYAASDDCPSVIAEGARRHFVSQNKPDIAAGSGFDPCGAPLRGLTASTSSLSPAQEGAKVTRRWCAESMSTGISRGFPSLGGTPPGWQRDSTEKRQLCRDRMTAGSYSASKSRSPLRSRRGTFSVHAVFDPHSLVLLSDFADFSDLPVRIELDPTREVITTHYVAELSEQAIKTVYLVLSLLFTWGCCVFGSMNDKFYDSDYYRKAGGDGTGHWLYEKQAAEEQAAREEMWSEDLLKEIEEKAEEVRKAEEEESKEEEKEVELV